MEAYAHQLKQNMRDQFRIQLMKLPSSIRRMPVREFCEVYHADINAVVSAEIIKSKNQNITVATPGGAPAVSSSARKTPMLSKGSAATAMPATLGGFDITKLQGMGVDEQLRYLQTMQSQIEAMQSQLKVAAK